LIFLVATRGLQPGISQTTDYGIAGRAPAIALSGDRTRLKGQWIDVYFYP
jgi:hypothetical protein